MFYLLNRRLARLDKKNDDRLTEYYKDFMAMCRRVCGRPLEEDSERGTNVESISEERASRCLFRVQLLSKIREEVLTHTYRPFWIGHNVSYFKLPVTPLRQTFLVWVVHVSDTLGSNVMEMENNAQPRGLFDHCIWCFYSDLLSPTSFVLPG